MPSYRAYGYITRLMVYEVEAALPQDVIPTIENGDYERCWLDVDYNEHQGISTIDVVTTGTNGQTKHVKVWTAVQGYACPSCGQFRGETICPCQQPQG